MTEERTGCDQCWPSDAETAWAARRALSREAELVDSSHLGVSILACPGCGQRFVYVFLEHVDWADGDDPQYCTLMPISEAEAAELSGLTGGAVVERCNRLPNDRRCLKHDWPKGGPLRTEWGSGMWIVE